MRRSLFLVLIAGLTLPAFAQSPNVVPRISVEQLEQTLAEAHGEPDAQVAHRLANLELTERLSEPRRMRLDADLPGTDARQALMNLTNASEFLDLPKAEIPNTPPPDRATQTAMLAKARDYVLKTILKLPNFFAIRETANFEGVPAISRVEAVNGPKFEPLHQVGRSSVTVLYRDRRELVAKGKKQEASTKELRTMGEFGPVLVTVFSDVANGKVIWSHWEQGAAGPMAVFHFSVPEQASHYLVSYNSIEHGAEHDPAYHGEIALNPDDGSILRLTAMAEQKAGDPILSADLLVDYGPVEIGGVSYVCPVKSVALSVVRMVIQELDFTTGAVKGTTLGQPRTYLNEVLFKQYHLFRAEARILTGSGPEPSTVTPATQPK